MSDIRLEDIKEAIHRMDLLMRPYVVFMSPENYEAVKAMFPNFEDEYQVQTVEWLEKDKCILIPRKELEEWRFGRIEFEEVEHE